MLRDITIGQHFPGNSFIHKLDPRFKIILTLVFVVMLFTANTYIGLFINFAFLVLSYFISKIPFKVVVRGLKPMIPIVIFMAIFNVFFYTGKMIYFQWGIFELSREGILMSLFMIVRIILVIAGTSLLTYTTSPIALTDAIERLLKPLKLVKFPVHELAMMMTIALRFIPTLVEETDKIMSAQKARGADIESGGLIKRAKALLPILIPLFISAFRRATELATAMECRCYRGGEGRTRMKQLHMGLRDIVATVVVCLLLGAVIYLNVTMQNVL